MARTSSRQPATPVAQVAYGVPSSNASIPDAYSELSLLLDSTEKPPRSNS